MEDADIADFQGFSMKDIPTVEELEKTNIFLCGIDIVIGGLVGQHPRRNIEKHSKAVRLLRYSNHICYVSNINALLESNRCASCKRLISRHGNLNRPLTTCIG